MTFLEYCRGQRSRKDAVGDFARDWCADPERPRAPRSATVLLEYLQDHGAIETAQRAGVRCWNEWRLWGSPR